MGRSLLMGIICCSLMCSCSTLYNTQITAIDIKVPGRVKFPSDFKTAAIAFNNINPAHNPNFSHYFEDNNKIEDTSNIDSLAAKVYFNVFIDHLENQQYFDSIKTFNKPANENFKWSDSLVFLQNDSPVMTGSGIFMRSNKSVSSLADLVNYFSDDSVKNKVLHYMDPDFGLYSENEIAAIADSTKADLLFSLDYFATIDGIFSRNFNANQKEKLDFNHFPVYIEEGLEVVYIMAFWNIYSLREKVHLTSYSKIDTIKWKEPAYNLKEAKRVLPPRKDAVLNAADISGSKLAEFLFPHWITVDRMYYQGSGSELKTTDALVKENRWIEAAEIWKKNTTNKNKSIAAKSSFNMALACEMNGYLDAAIDWLTKSYGIFGNENVFHAGNCLDYINILARRKLDIKLMESDPNPNSNSSPY